MRAGFGTAMPLTMCLVWLPAAACSAQVEAGRDAQAMADKFAAEAEAAGRRATEEKARAEAKAREAAALVARRRAEAQHKADEAEMLERARAESEARLAAIERERIERERREQQARAEQARLDAERMAVQLNALQAERRAELDRLSQKIRRVQESAGEARARLAAKEPAQEEPAGLGVSPPASSETHVAVLLVMRPGDRGIRRFNKTADPILCTDQICYVSRGPDAEARVMARSKAFGMLNTLGERAGACRSRLTCVFRNVDLKAHSARLQPIDLRLVYHDRREGRQVGADPTCRLEQGRMQCDRGVHASNYTLWTVPESVARSAGPAALQAALKAGLPAAQSASASTR